MKRKSLMLKMKINNIFGKANNNAKIIKRSGLFKAFGDRNYWHSAWLPSYPELISIGNNVKISADVRMYEHDIIHTLWN